METSVPFLGKTPFMALSVDEFPEMAPVQIDIYRQDQKLLAHSPILCASGQIIQSTSPLIRVTSGRNAADVVNSMRKKEMRLK
jgi:hypothetical protein